MNRRTRSILSRLSFSLIAVWVGSADLSASVVITTDWTLGSENIYSVSNADLLQTHLASISSDITPSFFAANNPQLLADGLFGTALEGAASVAPQAGGSVTFHLDLSVNTAGYTINSLASYAGWDSGRDGQEYTVFYSVASDPSTFIKLVDVPKFNALPFNGTYSTRIVLTDTTGVLIDNAAAIRYTFTSFESNGSAYREIDAFGVSAVPEPASLGLLTVGFAAMLGYARRRQRSCS